MVVRLSDKKTPERYNKKTPERCNKKTPERRKAPPSTMYNVNGLLSKLDTRRNTI